jgi:hypothetical protein
MRLLTSSKWLAVVLVLTAAAVLVGLGQMESDQWVKLVLVLIPAGIVGTAAEDVAATLSGTRTKKGK